MGPNINFKKMCLKNKANNENLDLLGFFFKNLTNPTKKKNKF